MITITKPAVRQYATSLLHRGKYARTLFTECTIQHTLRKKKAFQTLRYKALVRLITHHFFDLSFGGGFLGIRKRALIGCMSHKAKEIKEITGVKSFHPCCESIYKTKSTSE